MVLAFKILCNLLLVFVTGFSAPVPWPAGYGGRWELSSANAGVSAMHMNLIPLTNRVVVYDATVLGASNVSLSPELGCRVVDAATQLQDCFAHSVEYDTTTSQVKPLKVNTDTWCSSGSLTYDGQLVSVGGNKEGARTARYLGSCADCQWREFTDSLANARWYATQAILADNRFIIVGGRAAFSYEYMPVEGKKNVESFFFQFLKDTTDKDENNLYPFVHLSTDGNVFIFANSRSLLLNPYTNRIVRELPPLAGGSRNYPASGMSALLPIKLSPNNAAVIPAQVLICGGALSNAYEEAARQNFLPALDDCNTIELTDPVAVWDSQQMPSPRVMGDMLILPTGDILMINGAKRGTSAWEYAEDPNLSPVMYRTGEPDPNLRFVELAPTQIPRMYHSSSTVLPDGSVLVGGSNTHDGYKFDVKYPTELRLEKYHPPYLHPSLEARRPVVTRMGSKTKFRYAEAFTVQFTCGQLAAGQTRVALYTPPFSTHGVNMNQRMVYCEVKGTATVSPGVYRIVVWSPLVTEVAPAGYYLLFVQNGEVPSAGMWVQLLK